MADATCSGANTLFLPGEVNRKGIKLLFCAYGNFTSHSDICAKKYGLGFTHRRITYCIFRKPKLSLAQLLSNLRITKQSLARIFNQLVSDKSVKQNRGRANRPQRSLSLRKAGEKLEHHLSQPYRERVSYTYRKAGPNAAYEYRQIRLNLVKEVDRHTIIRSILGA